MMQKSDKDELILKVLDGIATPDEIQALARWMETDPENEVYFNQLKKAWNLTSGPVPSEERVEHELKSYMKYIRSKRGKFRVWQVLKYAAVIVVPLLLGIYWLQQEHMEEQSQMTMHKTGIVPGGYKATLITAQGKAITLLPSAEEDIRVQENFVVKNGQKGIVYQDTKKETTTLQYNTLKTPRGGEYTITLSDGTRVYLNAASKLKYPVQFDSKRREVYLSGEAYFEVMKDMNRPFYVVTDAVRVKVYGTEFNVNTNGIGGTQTTLVSGKVGIWGRGSVQEYIMKPFQLAEFGDNGEFKGIRDVDVKTYTAWKEGFFVFEDEGLEGILNRLSRWYDVDIFYSNERVKTYHFTGHMEKYENIETILNAISKMVGVHFTIKEKTIIVTE